MEDGRWKGPGFLEGAIFWGEGWPLGYVGVFLGGKKTKKKKTGNATWEGACKNLMGPRNLGRGHETWEGATKPGKGSGWRCEHHRHPRGIEDFEGWKEEKNLEWLGLRAAVMTSLLCRAAGLGCRMPGMPSQASITTRGRGSQLTHLVPVGTILQRVKNHVPHCSLHRVAPGCGRRV